MKKSLIFVIVIIVILALGFLGWRFLLKKSDEGGICKADKNCQEGLKCINNVCSSGKVGSVCRDKTDCLTPFCVEGKCTEGKRNDPCAAATDCSTNYCVSSVCTEGEKGDACLTYKDCQTGLLCQKGTCSNPPSYSQYLSKIAISKMKLGMPPGPDNIPVPTTEFKTTDAIEIDLIGVKSTTIGELYYEAVNSITGEVAFSTESFKQQIEGRDIGTGSDLPNKVGIGEFELNIYFNNEIIYTTTIKVSN